jgi:hypothetical protein
MHGITSWFTKLIAFARINTDAANIFEGNQIKFRDINSTISCRNIGFYILCFFPCKSGTGNFFKENGTT